MSQNECTAFFTANKGNTKIVHLLLNEQNRREWERLSASVHSPGLVGDEELRRPIQQPLYYNPKTKQLTPDAFNDAFDKGLSTDRLSHASIQEIIQRSIDRDASYAKNNPDKEPRVTIAVSGFQTPQIREYKDAAGAQFFGIFDTANKDNISHADVCAIVSFTNAERRKARAHLDFIQKLELLNRPSLANAEIDSQNNRSDQQN